MKRTTNFDALINRWHDRALTLREEGYSRRADSIERMIAEVEVCISSADSEVLSITRAASESGYSEEHLRRMLRDKPALNAGREGKPMIRRRNLPRKAVRTLVSTGPLAYDRTTDARDLMGRQGAS